MAKTNSLKTFQFKSCALWPTCERVSDFQASSNHWQYVCNIIHVWFLIFHLSTIGAKVTLSHFVSGSVWQKKEILQSVNFYSFFFLEEESEWCRQIGEVQSEREGENDLSILMKQKAMTSSGPAWVHVIHRKCIAVAGRRAHSHSPIYTIFTLIRIYQSNHRAPSLSHSLYWMLQLRCSNSMSTASQLSRSRWWWLVEIMGTISLRGREASVSQALHQNIK